jgi:hypothetical protein
MEEHFVTYNQALALKELGFDEPCFGKYDTKQGDEWLLNIYSGHLNAQFSDKNKACIAPLKSQVFKWFREIYNVQGYIYPLTVQGYKNGRIFTNYIYTIKDLYYIIESDPVNEEFETYEEAESACIDKLIELVKEKKL